MDLWVKLKFLRLKLSVEVFACSTRSRITHDYSIRINHWNDENIYSISQLVCLLSIGYQKFDEAIKHM